MKMNKNWIMALLCLLCAVMLIGCGADTAPAATPTPVESTAPVETPAPAETAGPAESPAPSAALPDAGLTQDTEPEPEADDSLFELARTFVDKPLSELQEKIGEPISSEYVSSCLIPGGQDGELHYDGFIVSTVKSGDTETVLDVRQG